MSIETLRTESKKTVRNPIAKVRITWTDPLIDRSIKTIASETNYVSQSQQVADLVNVVPEKWFHTNDTDVTLDGTWFPPPSSDEAAKTAQMGWWGESSCDINGDWSIGSYPTLTVDFAPRFVEGYLVTGDSALNEFPVDFTVELQKEILGTYVTLETVDIVDNDLLTYTAKFSQSYNNANRVLVTIKKWNTPEKVAKIVEFYTSVTEEFGPDDIVYMNILQEFEDSDGTLPVGNISCNELDLSLQNINDRFFPGNTDSEIYTFIKRNRRIEAFLGFQYDDGQVEYLQKGIYWSGDWAVSDLGTVAQTSARDRFEMMRKKEFPVADVFTENLFDVTVKDLMIAVLDHFSEYMVDFFYDLSDMNDIYTVSVFLPEFFENKNYFDVVKELSAASLSYSYMDEPTDDEKSQNGGSMKDIMRVKRLESVYSEDISIPDSVDITTDDFINKNQPANTEELANVIRVIYKVFTFDAEAGEWKSEDLVNTSRNEQSIREYGELVYEYENSDLIQQESTAQSIGGLLLGSFSQTRKDIEVDAFGDVTLKLTDTIIVPEYQKGNVSTTSAFSVKRLSSVYDGSLRQSIEGRKLKDLDPNVIEESPNAEDIIVEDKNNTDIIEEG